MQHNFNIPTELYSIHLTQDPCFPPAKQLWALKPDFHCGGRKKSEFAVFSFVLGAFAFFAIFFLRAFTLFFGFKLASAKALAPTFV
jgi:hypothetical protein